MPANRICFPVESKSNPKRLHTDQESKEVIPMVPSSSDAVSSWDPLPARQQLECSGIPATASRPLPSCGSPVPLLSCPRPPSSRGEKMRAPETSLVVQWLTIHLKMQKMSAPAQPQGAQSTEQEQSSFPPRGKTQRCSSIL